MSVLYNVCYSNAGSTGRYHFSYGSHIRKFRCAYPSRQAGEAVKYCFSYSCAAGRYPFTYRTGRILGCYRFTYDKRGEIYREKTPESFMYPWKEAFISHAAVEFVASWRETFISRAVTATPKPYIAVGQKTAKLFGRVQGNGFHGKASRFLSAAQLFVNLCGTGFELSDMPGLGSVFHISVMAGIDPRLSGVYNGLSIAGIETRSGLRDAPVIVDINMRLRTHSAVLRMLEIVNRERPAYKSCGQTGETIDTRGFYTADAALDSLKPENDAVTSADLLASTSLITGAVLFAGQLVHRIGTKEGLLELLNLTAGMFDKYVFALKDIRGFISGKEGCETKQSKDSGVKQEATAQTYTQYDIAGSETEAAYGSGKYFGKTEAETVNDYRELIFRYPVKEFFSEKIFSLLTRVYLDIFKAKEKQLETVIKKEFWVESEEMRHEKEENKEILHEIFRRWFEKVVLRDVLIDGEQQISGKIAEKDAALAAVERFLYKMARKDGSFDVAGVFLENCEKLKEGLPEGAEKYLHEYARELIFFDLEKFPEKWIEEVFSDAEDVLLLKEIGIVTETAIELIRESSDGFTERPVFVFLSLRWIFMLQTVAAAKELGCVNLQDERELTLWSRFWFLFAGDAFDRKILPCHDFPYEDKPIEFSGFDDLMPENWQVIYPETFRTRIDRHPIQNGADIGLREIPLAINIMIDVINILILMWSRFCSAFWDWTGTQAVIGITEAAYQWLTLEESIKEQENKDSRAHYERCYRWLRWEAEKVSLMARNDMELRGNFYVGILIEEMINYMLDHHFNAMPMFEDVNKMDEWRRSFDRDLQKDIEWTLDKVKGIRHKLIEGRERKHNA